VPRNRSAHLPPSGGSPLYEGTRSLRPTSNNNSRCCLICSPRNAEERPCVTWLCIVALLRSMRNAQRLPAVPNLHRCGLACETRTYCCSGSRSERGSQLIGRAKRPNDERAANAQLQRSRRLRVTDCTHSASHSAPASRSAVGPRTGRACAEQSRAPSTEGERANRYGAQRNRNAGPNQEAHRAPHRRSRQDRRGDHRSQTARGRDDRMNSITAQTSDFRHRESTGQPCTDRDRASAIAGALAAGAGCRRHRGEDGGLDGWNK
jgi:hypothetical protein